MRIERETESEIWASQTVGRNALGRRNIVPGASHVDATESSEPQGTLVSAVRILTNIPGLVLKLILITPMPRHILPRSSYFRSRGTLTQCALGAGNDRRHRFADNLQYNARNSAVLNCLRMMQYADTTLLDPFTLVFLFYAKSTLSRRL
ncbi:hypothetical protein EVAR_25701_1 [Eumeta japonica]|uniref:Uncharacterized protein n=1 Tax=Eumeta variegata TaxID=151549 RepID=A0A4C1WDL3_EUMVA|nr:hypothetical protein EVAR_25701_1 [Eumeta japonica]